MPLISMFFVTDNDVLDNSNCIFIYADNRKQSGDPSVNNKFRNMANAYPIILKSYGGSEAASYWKDDDFEVFKNEFTHSIDNIRNLMRRNAVGILCRESIDHDIFSPATIKDYSVQVHDLMLSSLHSLYLTFTPKLPRIPT